MSPAVKWLEDSFDAWWQRYGHKDDLEFCDTRVRYFWVDRRPKINLVSSLTMMILKEQDGGMG